MSTNWTLAVNGYPGITRPLPLVSLVAFVSSYPSDETFNRLTLVSQDRGDWIQNSNQSGAFSTDVQGNSIRCMPIVLSCSVIFCA